MKFKGKKRKKEGNVKEEKTSVLTESPPLRRDRERRS